jgi:hypothetical protein
MTRRIETVVKELRLKFEKAWCRDTCWHKGTFDPICPSSGQCYVTALCIKDILGGDIVQGLVFGQNHYWNYFSSCGKEFDLTSDQFGGDGIHRHPEAIWTNKFNHCNQRNKRYLLLKKRITAQIDLNTILE